MFRWNIHVPHTILNLIILFKFHYVQMEHFEVIKKIKVKELSLNSTMFRWNSIVEGTVMDVRDKFKFHYVQMEQKILESLFKKEIV